MLKLEEHIGEGHTDEEFKVGKGVPTVTTHLLTSAEQQGGRKEEKTSTKTVPNRQSNYFRSLVGFGWCAKPDQMSSHRFIEAHLRESEKV